jgi:hypothetical protein
VVASAHSDNAAAFGTFVDIYPVISRRTVHLHVVLSKGAKR